MEETLEELLLNQDDEFLNAVGTVLKKTDNIIEKLEKEEETNG